MPPEDRRQVHAHLERLSCIVSVKWVYTLWHWQYHKTCVWAELILSVASGLARGRPLPGATGSGTSRSTVWRACSKAHRDDPTPAARSHIRTGAATCIIIQYSVHSARACS